MNFAKVKMLISLNNNTHYVVFLFVDFIHKSFDSP